MRKVYITLMWIIGTVCFCLAARNRHVQPAWNFAAVNLYGTAFHGGADAWHYLDWFGVYYQSENWWIYHLDYGWMYPEADTSQGVWLYWEGTETWIWTHSDVYPFAWDNFTGTWFEWDYHVTQEFYFDESSG